MKIRLEFLDWRFRNHNCILNSHGNISDPERDEKYQSRSF